MNVALTDRPVNGLTSMLVNVGYLDIEAYFMGQAAYVNPSKHVAGSPKTVALKRLEILREIEQSLPLIESLPEGNEAHRRRIILWEKIFGRGSSMHQYDPRDVYLSAIDEYAALKNAYYPPNPEPTPDPAPPVVGQEYDFYLPGEVGDYSNDYRNQLYHYAADWINQHAHSQGFYIHPQSLKIEIMNIDLLRGNGHDLSHTGLQWHMGLAAHVVATGVQSQ